MTARLRTVFFGSSEFSIPALRALITEQDVVAVCTQPDKPAGRGLTLTPTPVGAFARDAGIEVLAPARLNAGVVAQVAARTPALLAVASYGKILPHAMLAIPGAVALNLHPSMLPAYRGATPIQTALRDGREQTGVTVFWMSEGMDEGDVALAKAVPIAQQDDYGSLHDKLAAVGAELLAEAARALVQGTLPRIPQRAEEATYTKPLTKEDLRLRLDVPAQTAVNQIRSLSPKPGAWMMFDGKRLKVLKGAASDTTHLPTDSVVEDGHVRPYTTLSPGDLVAWTREGGVIATHPGAIILTTVVPEGKPAMSGAEFAKRARESA